MKEKPTETYVNLLQVLVNLYDVRLKAEKVDVHIANELSVLCYQVCDLLNLTPYEPHETEAGA